MSDFRIFYQASDGDPGGEFLACTWCGEPFQLKWQPVFSFVASSDEEMFGESGRVRVHFDLCSECTTELQNDIDAFFSEVPEVSEEGGEDDGL